jgi:hypothetical protein
MEKNPKAWLKEGKQSKLTEAVKEIATNFSGSGSDFEKVMAILKWMGKNLKRKKGREALKIFATRTTTEILEDRFSTGCHDDALVFATLCRAVEIPAKYVVGINRHDPENKGHCVVEAHVDKNWVLIDQSNGLIYLNAQKNDFYKENFAVGKKLDSWEIGIKSFESWKEKSKEIAKTAAKTGT